MLAPKRLNMLTPRRTSAETIYNIDASALYKIDDVANGGDGALEPRTAKIMLNFIHAEPGCSGTPGRGQGDSRSPFWGPPVPSIFWCLRGGTETAN